MNKSINSKLFFEIYLQSQLVCVLLCDGLATCPGCTPPLAHRLLEIGTSFPAKVVVNDYDCLERINYNSWPILNKSLFCEMSRALGGSLLQFGLVIRWAGSDLAIHVLVFSLFPKFPMEM
ncbi:hypothetical protein CHARACLAT_005991 [Characodon lateralis]|uniref:Uncharacterized protein n=1 Tax=Characodon lateralis TaxID=208331 RepID=A0ABU7D7L4_9TELE|nr:hypothetical protein [Characodon lateralis]